MKGRNTMTLNHATLVQALQLWADAAFRVPVRIESVEQLNAGAVTPSFEVVVVEPAGKEPAS